MLHQPTVAGFLLAQIDAVYETFALNLTQIGVHIWSLVTFWLFEPNVIVLLGNILCIHLGRTVLEPVWRRWELLRVAVLVNVATLLATRECAP